VPLTQVPPWHASPVVHALLSLHAVPSGMAMPAHAPVAGLHAWAPRHIVAPGQVTGLPPVQTPDWHVSVCVQALLSLHDVPLVTGVCTQPVAGLHESAVHGLLSSHGMAALEHVPAAQMPSETWHLSAAAHVTPSAFWQAPVALHALQAPHALLEQQNPSVQNAPATH